MQVKSLLRHLAVAGVMLPGVLAAPAASAAFTASLDPAAVSGFVESAQSFAFSLNVSGLDELGIDLADSPGISATIEVTAGSPFRIQLYDDPGTAADYTTDSLGDVFSGVADASVAAGPLPGPDTRKELSFVYLGFDVDTFETLSLNASGTLVRFVLTSDAGVSPGDWEVHATVSLEGDSGTFNTPVAVAATSLVAVPEPQTYAMFGVGLALLGAGVARARRRN